jgi:hypothetical protein
VKQTTLSTTFLSAGMLLVYIGVIFIPSWITKVRSAHKR